MTIKHMNKTGETLAYCFADGTLHFTDSACPDGALPIARGTGQQWRERIEVKCRLTKDGATYLVPGIPEASNTHEKYQAFVKFRGGLQELDDRMVAKKRRAK